MARRICKIDAEIVVLGSGFAGSLMALVLQKQGRDVVLLDRSRHPRFAIGESSTPLANLSLESICRTYDLNDLLPLCKYGSWQAHHPSVPCGLKRGFSFFKHERGRAFAPRDTHDNELLVAASPSDELGDTQWFREAFDALVVKRVTAAGIPYLDSFKISSVKESRRWSISGTRESDDFDISAQFLVDATGASSVVGQALDVPQRSEAVKTCSWSVFSHFVGVEPWSGVLTEAGANVQDHPFSCDDAALHHILDDGWIWALRFNNGVTSVGMVFDGKRLPQNDARLAEEIWADVLRDNPAVLEQLCNAERVRPFTRTKRLQRRFGRVSGRNWVMLPSSAYFIDPLLSVGNAHALLGVERIADIFGEHWGTPNVEQALRKYDAALQREIDYVDMLIHGCYRAFRNFDILCAFMMYYFAGAIVSEARRRDGEGSVWDGFLFSDCCELRTAVQERYADLANLVDAGQPPNIGRRFAAHVARDIEAINLGGLCDPAKHNMYPFQMTASKSNVLARS